MLSKFDSENLIANSIRRYSLAAELTRSVSDEISSIAIEIATSLANGGKILIFGNGGSAAAAQHFAAEFTGKLKLHRRPYPAIALTTDTSALTAIGNDYGFNSIFSRQVEAHCKPGDFAIGLSTSGSSPNVQEALAKAAEVGGNTVLLCGSNSTIKSDFTLAVPLHETARIQEAHDMILHSMAQLIERNLDENIGSDSSADPFPFQLEGENISEFSTWMSETNQVTVTTNGVFDLFHRGHRNALKEAAALGDRLIVLLNSDESVARLKGPGRPIRNINERISDMESCPFVSHVVVFDTDEPSLTLDRIKPQLHVKGSDYQNRELPETEVIKKNGGKIIFTKRTPEVSTSEQIWKINAKLD